MATDLQEALAAVDAADPDPHEDWEWVARILEPAARKWADLEAQVADGARVVVETPCDKHGLLVLHLNATTRCLPERRVILGEGSEQ